MARNESCRPSSAPRIARRIALLFGLLPLLGPAAASAQGIGTVASMDGAADIERGGVATPVRIGTVVDLGDVLRTSSAGRLRLVFQDDTVLAVGRDTEIVIAQPIFDPRRPGQSSLLRLRRGRIRVLVDDRYRQQGAVYEVETPTGLARVRGTEFVIVYDPVAEVTDVVGVTEQVAVHSVLDRVGRGVVVSSRELTHVYRGQYPTIPEKLDETLFRQYLEGLVFIGEGEAESMTVGEPVLLGSAVGDPERAENAPALALGEEELPGPGVVFLPPRQEDVPLSDLDDPYLPPSVLDQPLDVLEAIGGDVGVEF
jgi:hypothetical protein